MVIYSYFIVIFYFSIKFFDRISFISSKHITMGITYKDIIIVYYAFLKNKLYFYILLSHN